MKLAIAQINVTVGDLAGNAAKILDYANQAKAQGASLMLTPELALAGYPPEDLLLRAGFYVACRETLQQLASAIHGITVVVGHPHEENKLRYNAASVIQDGKIIATYYKLRLPNYGVFDEVRYFTPGTEPCVFTVRDTQFGINICADIWETPAASCALGAGAQVLLVLNASPFHMDKHAARYDVARERIAETGVAIVYTNLVGGQDELVFDGASFVMNRAGEICLQLPAFEEALGTVEIVKTEPRKIKLPKPLSLIASIYRALTLGVQDYVEKNGFPNVVLGLSGGIDSALTLAIAVDALGAARVSAVMMPSPYTAAMSVADASEMATNLQVSYSEIPIQDLLEGYIKALAPQFSGTQADTTEENLQARIRGNLLMALSNKFGAIVLTTGNKSEMAVGYATLYGDMAGGFAVLKDVPKTIVYQLAEYRNSLSAVIPERIITRPPSAELKAGQTDQDTLPPYEILDGIMEAYVEYDLCPAQIIAAGFTEKDVRRVIQMIDRNEYKRRQSPVGVRITQRAFGKDRRYPITSKYQPRFRRKP